jgi:hypothetical protein
VGWGFPDGCLGWVEARKEGGRKEGAGLLFPFFEFKEERVPNIVQYIPFIKCMNLSALIIYIKRITVPNLH